MTIWVVILATLALSALAGIPLLLKKRILPPLLPPAKGSNLKIQVRRKEVLTMRHIANQLENAFRPVAEKKGFEVSVELPHTNDVIGRQSPWIQAIIRIRPLGRPHRVSEQFVVDMKPSRMKDPITVTSNGSEVLSLRFDKEMVKVIISAGLAYMDKEPKE